jgi:SM-20-related protein
VDQADLPQLNLRLDRAVLKREFDRAGRIHIRNILTEASAERVHRCLKDETAYDLCLNIGGSARTLRHVTPQERQRYAVAAWREVGAVGFRFLFDMHVLTLHGEPYADPGHYWAKFVGFLNGAEFLALARELTGLEGIEFADAQATVYRSGDFLTAHDDNVPGAHRLIAYVLGFTPLWRPEWGGLLEFLDTSSEVETSYVPGFNTLKLFRVPMPHYVSMVAPSAQSGRYSVTGWLRAR